MEFVKSIPSGRQRGLSLIYAMLALAVLALATVALIRSVSTGAVVAGNLGFQQEATAAADQAVRQAIASLGARLAAASTGLDADGVIAGYYASTDDEGRFTLTQVPAGKYELVCWLPSWHIRRREHDPETGTLARVQWASPVEQTRSIDVQARRVGEVQFQWSAKRFPNDE